MNKAFLLGVAVCLTLPLLGCASKDIEQRQTSMMQNQEGKVMNRGIWHQMTDVEKQAYARQSLEDVGENPDAFVSQGRTRETLLLEGLNAVYDK
ncbi:MAG: hypothetical protein Q9N67_09625 [Ghiorsea sp.]|nr:hypothetical protein [Ghiorsea sp.]